MSQDQNTVFPSFINNKSFIITMKKTIINIKNNDEQEGNFFIYSIYIYVCLQIDFAIYLLYIYAVYACVY